MVWFGMVWFGMVWLVWFGLVIEKKSRGKEEVYKQLLLRGYTCSALHIITNVPSFLPSFLASQECTLFDKGTHISTPAHNQVRSLD
ncbi:hypothetical protein M0802_003937 [Mischocyttarus mexicanus]|nr:hypothetical protein M0802_003937 [Mischocyttarus mexicanus]